MFKEVVVTHYLCFLGLALFQVAESVDYISAEEGKVAAPTECPPLPGTLRLLGKSVDQYNAQHSTAVL